MKNKRGFLTVCLLCAVYALLSLWLVNNKNEVFWAGFGFAMLSFILLAALLLILPKTKEGTTQSFAVFAVSAAYIATVLIANLLFGGLLKLHIKLFASIQVVLLALFCTIQLLFFVVRPHMANADGPAQADGGEAQAFICQLEKIKGRMIGLSDKAGKRAIQMLDNLIDDIRFSESRPADTDGRIASKLAALSSEIENLILIDSPSAESAEALIAEIKGLVHERNIEIRAGRVGF